MKLPLREGRVRRAGAWAAPVAALLLTIGLLASAGPAGAGAASASRASVAAPDFGPNVYVFDPSMPLSQIQATVNAVAAQQVDNQFGSQRYALLFKPGTYGTQANPLIIQVGYYTEVAGLGASPGDVTINGHVDVYNQCFAPDNCIGLVNFWRSVSNLTINVTGLSGCRSSADFWAVSQAAPMRRVNITGGNLTLLDYCTAGPQYTSGGFIADSQTGFVINGSQQQFLVRNSSIGGWSNAVWNQVFAGVQGAPAQSFPNPPYTTLDTTPVTRERPFLYVDGSGNWNVFVPAPRTDSTGTSWASGPAAGRSIPLSDFYIAKPGDNLGTITSALARGMNLILTPGVYDLADSIKVKKADTVVLGLGFPTLIPQNGTAAMTVADVKGVDLAGLLIDAGPVNSNVLLQVGTPNAHKGDPADPTALQDVFFRIGGAAAGRATTSLVVNSDNTILDDIWAWRADHGNPGTVGWTVNTADTGLVVNGDDVTAYGLFVEHFQKYEVLWNGERGRTIMFQNEMPYDPPDQASWRTGPILGYAAYKVADSVKQHEGWGLGSYCFFNVNPSIHATRAFEVPVTPGVKFHDLLTISLAAGTIDHVINDTGGPTPINVVPVNIVSYP
jgi:hypothetical protein